MMFGFGAGGAGDVAARFLSQKLSDSLGPELERADGAAGKKRRRANAGAKPNAGKAD
jgi:hypothetical protein